MVWVGSEIDHASSDMQNACHAPIRGTGTCFAPALPHSHHRRALRTNGHNRGGAVPALCRRGTAMSKPMSLAVIRSRSLDGLRRTRGHRRSAPGQWPAELHAGRPGRHRGEGSAGAGARRTAEQRPRVPAQQAHHGQSGAGRPAQGVGPLRSADRARHPGRERPGRPSAPGRVRVRGRTEPGRRPAARARRARDGARAETNGRTCALLCCPGAAPKRRRWSKAWPSMAQGICWMWCAPCCPQRPRAPCRAPSQRRPAPPSACPTCAK